MPNPVPQRVMPNRVVPRPTQNLVKIPSVWDRVVPIGEDLDDAVKLLVFGDSGTGKTSFASTFPEPLLWVQCSGSKRPGELRSVNTPENAKRIRKFTPSNPDEALQIVDGVVDKGFNSIILDHLSGLEDLIFCAVTGMSEAPAQKSWGMCSQQQWGQIAAQEKDIVRKLLNLQSINVIILAQERTFKPKDTGDGEEIDVSDVAEGIGPKVGPGVVPSMAAWLRPAVDYVVQTYKAPKFKQETVGEGKAAITINKRLPGVEYRLRTEPHTVIMTKFRLPMQRSKSLPGHIVDPTYAKLVKLIRG